MMSKHDQDRSFIAYDLLVDNTTFERAPSIPFERVPSIPFERAPSMPLHNLCMYGDQLDCSLDMEMLSRPIPQLAVEVAKVPSQSMSSSSPSSEAASSTCWSDVRRAKHRLSCRSKSKLTIAEKLAIVQDHEHNRTSQAALAARYGKSKSAISKILRPDNIARLRSITSVGVEASQSCCAKSHNLELEKRLHVFVEANMSDRQWRMQTRRKAGELAAELGIEGFQATKGWCNRFIKRHGF
uniref:HTH CENPB-type domain-containing protein n=1 Tax=Hanusia phi TaxID=3032 RepID=A0A7S0DXP3_9CRYP|mmetsp:Transcript_12538/g.28821  ORF Transcript_12538/g.28821 Transcript_12538/m.28821 type:complete len:240 (+) Transcript_12538:250-969(+)